MSDVKDVKFVVVGVVVGKVKLIVFEECFQMYMLEEVEDNKIFRIVGVVVVLFYFGLFVVQFFELFVDELEEVEKFKVYVVQQVWFKLLLLKEEKEILKFKVKKVLILDFMFDELELICIEELEDFDILEVDDFIIGIFEVLLEFEFIGLIYVMGDVQKLEKISLVLLQYIEIVCKVCIQGVVIFQLIIDEQGNVIDVFVLKGFLMGFFEVVMEVVKQWKYKLVIFNGKFVVVYFNFIVNFQL